MEIPAHDPKHDHAQISDDEVHFLDPGFLNPAENMALDALLLDLPGWWFRLTRWSTPCVTLGRFQTFPDGVNPELEESEQKDGIATRDCCFRFRC